MLAALLGSIKSETKAQSSRRNGNAGGAPKRDFEYKPKVKVTLAEGTILEFLYRRGNYLYWKTPDKKKTPNTRYKTSMEGDILEVFKPKPKE
jgi:hypothetical protein